MTPQIEGGPKVQTCAEYLNAAKAALGNTAMSDRELGERLGGYAQQSIANGRAGRMSDPMAVKVAEVLGIEPGELLLVARAEREKDAVIRAHLLAYAGKVLGRASHKALSAFLALGVALGLAALPRDAMAAGGSGR